MPYIVSTLTHDVNYTFWKSNPGGINVKKEIDGKTYIRVKGGHGVAKRDSTGGLFTPNGVVTQVTDAELALLKSDEVFQTHMKHGAVKILQTKVDPKKVAPDLSVSPDAPLTSKDFQKGGRAANSESARVNGGKKLQ